MHQRNQLSEDSMLDLSADSSQRADSDHWDLEDTTCDLNTDEYVHFS